MKVTTVVTSNCVAFCIDQIEEPIYGSLNTDFTTFITPGAVLRSVQWIRRHLQSLDDYLPKNDYFMKLLHCVRNIAK